MIPRKSPTTPTTTRRATATPRIARAKVAVKKGLLPRPATSSLRMKKRRQVLPAVMRGLLPHPATSLQMRKRRQARSPVLRTAQPRGTRGKSRYNIQLMRLPLKPLRRTGIARSRGRKPAPRMLVQRRRSPHLNLNGELFVNSPVTIPILRGLPMRGPVGRDNNHAS